MPYIIEVWERGKYEEIPSTLRPTKNDLEKEVDEMNSSLPLEKKRLLPVSKKYRVKKVKGKKDV